MNVWFKIHWYFFKWVLASAEAKCEIMAWKAERGKRFYKQMLGIRLIYFSYCLNRQTVNIQHFLSFPTCSTFGRSVFVNDIFALFFRDILNFLRSGDLPPRERVRSVYKEAQYYSIGPLLDNLEDIQPLKGEKVRQAFLGLMPYYKGK